MTKGAFFIVGPTAAGKSELAADIAVECEAEIVNADAFQIYQGLDVLSGKPDASTLGKVRHHLIGMVPPSDEMNAEKFRNAACGAIEGIQSRNKLAIVVGGSGLYVKALTHGLWKLPAADDQLRKEFEALGIQELRSRLLVLDPGAAGRIDLKNRRRVIRALEICLLTGRPVSEQSQNWAKKDAVGGAAFGDLEGGAPATPGKADSQELASPASGAGEGVFVFRDRDDLYKRINSRVERMLQNGAIEEVRKEGSIGATAEKMIGLQEIREYLAGDLSMTQCAEAMQQATRRYAKRQLTWFRHQTSFEPLNLSLLSHTEAVEWVSRRALARRGNG